MHIFLYSEIAFVQWCVAVLIHSCACTSAFSPIIFRRTIKLSSPKLSNITAFGCILVYAAVILLGLDHSTLPGTEKAFPVVCTVSITWKHALIKSKLLLLPIPCCESIWIFFFGILNSNVSSQFSPSFIIRPIVFG